MPGFPAAHGNTAARGFPGESSGASFFVPGASAGSAPGSDAPVPDTPQPQGALHTAPEHIRAAGAPDAEGVQDEGRSAFSFSEATASFFRSRKQAAWNSDCDSYAILDSVRNRQFIYLNNYFITEPYKNQQFIRK